MWIIVRNIAWKLKILKVSYFSIILGRPEFFSRKKLQGSVLILYCHSKIYRLCFLKFQIHCICQIMAEISRVFSKFGKFQ